MGTGEQHIGATHRPAAVQPMKQAENAPLHRTDDVHLGAVGVEHHAHSPAFGRSKQIGGQKIRRIEMQYITIRRLQQEIHRPAKTQRMKQGRHRQRQPPGVSSYQAGAGPCILFPGDVDVLKFFSGKFPTGIQHRPGDPIARQADAPLQHADHRPAPSSRSRRTLVEDISGVRGR